MTITLPAIMKDKPFTENAKHFLEHPSTWDASYFISFCSVCDKNTIHRPINEDLVVCSDCGE